MNSKTRHCAAKKIKKGLIVKCINKGLKSKKQGARTRDFHVPSHESSKSKATESSSRDRSKARPKNVQSIEGVQ